MIGPYSAEEGGRIAYTGNRVCNKIDNIQNGGTAPNVSDPQTLARIIRIYHQVAQSCHEWFTEAGSFSVPVPTTTRMVAPGALYGKNFMTPDTAPVPVDWGRGKKRFLSNSPHMYLELALLSDLEQVHALAGSFHKTQGGATYLPESHAVYYEGKITQEENETHALQLMQKVIRDLLSERTQDVAYFIGEDSLPKLEELAATLPETPHVAFDEVLAALQQDTGNDSYDEFTQQWFGTWEEVRTTQIYGGMVRINHLPASEMPFSYALLNGVEKKWNRVDLLSGCVGMVDLRWPSRPVTVPTPVTSAVVDGSRFVWPGFRNIIQSGQRARTSQELQARMREIKIPHKDYEHYLALRESPLYHETSGFTMEIEQLIQGILEMPFISSVTPFR